MAGLEVLVDFAFTDFMIWKGLVLMGGALIYGIYIGFTAP
jgi:hypothetical protein